MKVRVDLALCQGHARCESICPDVFATDDVEGKCVIRMEDVSPRLEETARLAVRNCPEGALWIADEREREDESSDDPQDEPQEEGS